MALIHVDFTLSNARQFGPCVFCAPLDRNVGGYVDRYIGQVVHNIHTIQQFYSSMGNPLVV